eukprot:CAMPEP_0119535474 /NCGR_PEP_ID=MMETSP1344-20130328/48505_1 /TAXON_ID=236787 /ORGANISM="Florenciella parvula, Strain CCMP2471" /LENGTH=54 /DNA_ID=CAMNT_0007577107 /DNA_START=40 /DNA_END=200 /DNA_ORIENTATION=-
MAMTPQEEAGASAVAPHARIPQDRPWPPARPGHGCPRSRHPNMQKQNTSNAGAV